MRVEQRLDGSLAVRFQERYLTINECVPPPKVANAKTRKPAARKASRRKSDWMKNFHLGKSDTRKKNSAR